MKTATFGKSCEPVDTYESFDGSGCPDSQNRWRNVARKCLPRYCDLKVIRNKEHEISKQLAYGVSCKKDEFYSWGWDKHSFDGFITYYKDRANGIDVDSPVIPIPQDGFYSLTLTSNDHYDYKRLNSILYTEGPGDKAWMEERDKNYLYRLATGDIRGEEEQKDALVQKNAPFPPVLQEVTDNHLIELDIGARLLVNPGIAARPAITRTMTAPEILQILTAIKNNASLMVLALRGVVLNTTACTALCEILRTKILATIDLTGTNIPEIMRAIVKDALEANKSLQHIIGFPARTHRELEKELMERIAREKLEQASRATNMHGEIVGSIKEVAGEHRGIGAQLNDVLDLHLSLGNTNVPNMVAASAPSPGAISSAAMFQPAPTVFPPRPADRKLVAEIKSLIEKVYPDDGTEDGQRYRREQLAWLRPYQNRLLTPIERNVLTQKVAELKSSLDPEELAQLSSLNISSNVH